MFSPPEQAPGPLQYDDKERLPLGPVTSWEVARAVVLLHAQEAGRPLSPTDIKNYLTAELGWRPSNHSLYNGILKPLRNDGGLHRDLLTNVELASDAHPLTRYTPGSKAAEIVRIRLPRIADRLRVTRRFLRAVLPLLPANASEAPGTIVTNTATLMRWLCLHYATEGPKTQAELLLCLRSLSQADWPSKSMCYRAISELAGMGAVTFSGERPARIALTPTGQEVYYRLGHCLRRPVEDALHFAEAAAAKLRKV